MMMYFILLLLSSNIPLSSSTSSPTFVYAGCSPPAGSPSPAFFQTLNSQLTLLLSSSSHTLFNTTTTTTTTTLFSLYQCRSDVSLPQCSLCLHSAANHLSLLCPSSTSASLQLDLCLLRYSTSNFLSSPDNTLVYKTCNPKTTSEPEFFRRRDAVLGELLHGGGVGFRVSDAGGGVVHGMVQCLGDVGREVCEDCVGVAVAEVVRECGAAVAGAVYLGKCYARYWATGYYAIGNPTGSSGITDDDIGKTAAIIVGILAGLALIVVFLSFLRKSLG